MKFVLPLNLERVQTHRRDHSLLLAHDGLLEVGRDGGVLGLLLDQDLSELVHDGHELRAPDVLVVHYVLHVVPNNIVGFKINEILKIQITL